MSELYLGTSGWSYDDWVGDFYSEGTDSADMLEHYAGEFDSTEINATFYRLPFENMVKGWKDKVPESFSFSVKGSRKITRYNRLENEDDYLERFLKRVGQLDEHLETMLWQLPRNFEKNRDRLEAFLESLPGDHRHAFEFRDTSWLDDEIYQLLEDHNAAPVWVSSGEMPDDCTPTADFIYIRLHGFEDDYTYSYSRDELEPWAEVIRQNMEEGRDAFVYFNNTAGNAPESVRMMRELLGED